MQPLPQALIRHFRATERVGEPAGGADLAGQARNAACGDHVVLYLRVAEGRVAAAGFRAQGCPAAMATAAAACEVLEGLPADEGLGDALRARFEAAYGAPRPAHRHALALVVEALVAARAGAPPRDGAA